MELWQMDIVGRIHLADGTELYAVTAVDDHSNVSVYRGRDPSSPPGQDPARPCRVTTQALSTIEGGVKEPADGELETLGQAHDLVGVELPHPASVDQALDGREAGGAEGRSQVGGKRIRRFIWVQPRSRRALATATRSRGCDNHADGETSPAPKTTVSRRQNAFPFAG
jgi:hypothetical protein